MSSAVARGRKRGRQNFIYFILSHFILSYHIYLGTSQPSSTIFLHLTSDMSELAPLDPDLLAEVLSKHPFVTIDGVFNVRDLGMIPVEDSENVTRSGFMYRSGELSGVTPLGVCHSSSRELVVIPESREGAVAGPWHYHYLRPTFRHGNCKVRCNNPPNCRSDRIARPYIFQRGL